MATRPPIPVLSTNNLSTDNAADYCAIQMTLVHNLFIRAINSMNYHAQYVENPQDRHDFQRFCRSFVSILKMHHDTEETIIFPMWAEAAGEDLMQENVEAHQLFHDALENLDQYTSAEFDRDEFYRIMGELIPPLVVHLSSEIDTILTLREYPSEKILKAWKAGEKEVLERASNYEQLPFGLGCNDVTYEGGKHKFLAIPWMLRFMLTWWYGRRYQGAWRFCPSDANGMPRKPMFGPE